MFEHLTWLPPAPDDFSQRVRAASSGLVLRELAKHALTENQLRKLAHQLKHLQSGAANLAPLQPVAVGLISNASTDHIAPALIGTAMRHGMALTVEQAAFNQVAQAAFASEDVFRQRPVAFILVAIDHHGLAFNASPGDAPAAQASLSACLSYLRSVIDGLKSKSSAQVILQNFAPPADTPFGSYEARLPGTLSWLVTQINHALSGSDFADTLILDVADLAAKVGTSHWHDPTLWHVGKYAFSPRYVPIFADHLCRIVSARLGKSRRCLILDLDNTLWGGIVGDDGVDGILIGNGDPTAEAHLQVQRSALDLHARGVVLAVCSKNDEATARAPFRQRGDMLIKEAHIAVFKANWTDKATNIRAIADELALGLDSMVFLDDNPAERLQVRRELPDVAVPELPDDPARYVGTLLAAGYFEAVAFSDEDRHRADYYQNNLRRTQALEHSANLAEYLESLRMEMICRPFDPASRARITQLVNKTNQFNLTTRRYNEQQITAFEQDPHCYTRQIRLMDAFGDNGIVGVVICRCGPTNWEIDTWLMSCRVLGRRLEEAVLADMVHHARSAGALTLTGRYIPTARNGLVAQHYSKLGFSRVGSDQDTQTWSLELASFIAPQLPIKVRYAV